MKRIFMVIALCLTCALSFVANAQLNVSESGNNSSDVLAKDLYCKVVSNNTGYFLSTKDFYTPNTIELKLGSTENEFRLSAEQLIEWFDNAKKKSYITVNQDGQTLTIYKYDNSYFYMSYGDENYIAEMIKLSIMNSFAGGTYGEHNEKNPLIGCCTIKVIRKSIGR